MGVHNRVLVFFSFHSAYTEPYKVCPISVIPIEDVTSDEEQKSSEDEDSNQGDSNLIQKVKKNTFFFWNTFCDNKVL